MANETTTTTATTGAETTGADSTATTGGEGSQTDTTATTGGEGAGGEQKGSENAEAGKKAGEEGGEQKGKDDAKGKDGEGEKDGEGKDGEAAVGEYQDFKLPEGAQIDDVIMGDFKAFGQANKLTQDQMQGLLDLQGKLNQRMVEAAKETRAQWRKDAESDKEFGGAKLEASKATIAAARDNLASQAFVDLMDQFGLSDHPEVLRHFYKLGLKISEDNTAGNGGKTSTEKEEPRAADILYGKKETK